MPEAPEISYIRDYITEYCKGDNLMSVEILKGRYKKHGVPENYKDFKSYLPLKLLKVEKKGKVLFLYFENNWCIISKLGLTGWWYVDDDEPTWKTVTPNIVFQFKKVTLYYTDQLSYGTLIFTHDQAVIDKELHKLAPDIEAVNLKTFLEQVVKKQKTDGLIEDAIIDQHKFVSGIGNYLKSEILYHAKISPLRSVHSLSAADWKEIFKSAKSVIKKIYKNVNDEHAYMDTMKVYQKEVDPLGNKIHKHKTKEGRTTFWVPSIQT